MNSWGDFLRTLRELKSPEAKEMFETIIIDTADIAYDLCESYICSQNDVDSIGDIPFGKGYGLVAKEFDEKLRSITQMEYGLVQISHSVDKVFTDESDKEFNQIVPTLPKKAQTIVSRMCDIIGYSRSVTDDEGKLGTRLFLRGTPRFIAGSRFPDVPEANYKFPTSIEFNYNNLVDTIGDAVEALEIKYGAGATTDEVSKHNIVETKDLVLEDLLEEFDQVATNLMESDPEYFGPRIKHCVDKHFGTGSKISEATIAQVDLVDLVLYEVKELKKK